MKKKSTILWLETKQLMDIHSNDANNRDIVVNNQSLWKLEV